ncbi:TPM domain-containing protein [Parabacteroides distasonis]|nr:TPM domain-containing protein [Parabacteroides distasonis]
MSEIKNIRSRRKCPVSLLWISLLLVGFASSIFAAKDYSIETIPNVRLSNRLNHVSNPDGIITPDDAARINQLLNVVEDSLGIEVAVVAVNSIGDQDARMFATDLFKHWGLGQKSKDNGLLIRVGDGTFPTFGRFRDGIWYRGCPPRCDLLPAPAAVYDARSKGREL